MRLSEARFRSVLDSATDAVLTTDESHHIVLANPAAAELLGSPLDELCGAPLERWIPDLGTAAPRSDRPTFSPSGMAAFHWGERGNLAVLRPDGRTILIELTMSQVMIDGRPFHTVTARDLSERDRMNEQLLASKARLSAAMSSMRDAVFIYSAEGELIDCNEAFASFHRFRSKGECLRQLQEPTVILEVRNLAGELMPPQAWPRARALRGETEALLELRLRRKDTGEAWVGSYSFGPIRDECGTLVGAVASARDITASMKLREDLADSNRELQRLLAAQHTIEEAERKRIAREVHDDLQQRLAALRMSLGMMTRQARVGAPQLSPLAEKAMNAVDAAIDATRRIVHDLRHEIVDQAGLSAALAVMLRDFSERTGIGHELDLTAARGDGLSPELVTCLYRIAQEAIHNIHQHAEARTVRLRLDQSSKDQVCLWIEDDGKGLQPPTPGKARSYGLLGMRERTDMLGGSLKVSAGDLGGVTVEVILPIVEKLEARPGVEPG